MQFLHSGDFYHWLLGPLLYVSGVSFHWGEESEVKFRVSLEGSP